MSEQLLDVLNILLPFMLGLIGACVPILVQAINEKRRLKLEEHSQTREDRRAEVEAAERMTGTAGRLTEMSESVAQQVFTQMQELKQQLADQKARADLMEAQYGEVKARQDAIVVENQTLRAVRDEFRRQVSELLELLDLSIAQAQAGKNGFADPRLKSMVDKIRKDQGL